MKATILVDNISEGALKGEWGLSIYIEHEGHKILLDTGASFLFAKNAGEMGINLKEIEYAALSHAHYDHANGMEKFFMENDAAKMYLRESTAENCYAKKFIFRKYIGIPKGIMAKYPERIEIARGDVELYEGAWLIPHKTPGLEAIGKRESMYQKTANGWKPDDYSHEQSLVLDTDKGLVIFNCCSHGGAYNIINEVKATFPEKNVYGIVGGFHLFNKSNKEILEFARAVKETGVEKVITGHCTKERALKLLQQELGDRVEALHVGLEITV